MTVTWPGTGLCRIIRLAERCLVGELRGHRNKWAHVVRVFAELYRTQHQEAPAECRDVDYGKRIRVAYPIRPEIFDRLYTDWSTLVELQRTRGVWLAMRLSVQGSLAARASKKLKSDELLVTGCAAKRLRVDLDCVPLWRGDRVSIKQIWEDFARYLDLPRVSNPTDLLSVTRGGASLLTWVHDAVAVSDSFVAGAMNQVSSVPARGSRAATVGVALFYPTRCIRISISGWRADQSLCAMHGTILPAAPVGSVDNHRLLLIDLYPIPLML